MFCVCVCVCMCMRMQPKTDQAAGGADHLFYQNNIFYFYFYVCMYVYAAEDRPGSWRRGSPFFFIIVFFMFIFMCLCMCMQPKTDQAAGGADHIMELLFLRYI